MPEIWLGYGDSEIILDIKYENISIMPRPSMNNLDLEKLEIEIQNKIVMPRINSNSDYKSIFLYFTNINIYPKLIQRIQFRKY